MEGAYFQGRACVCVEIHCLELINKMCALEYIWKLLGMLASALAWDYKAQLMMLRPTILVCLQNTV